MKSCIQEEEICQIPVVLWKYHFLSPQIGDDVGVRSQKRLLFSKWFSSLK